MGLWACHGLLTLHAPAGWALLCPMCRYCGLQEPLWKRRLRQGPSSRPVGRWLRLCAVWRPVSAMACYDDLDKLDTRTCMCSMGLGASLSSTRSRDGACKPGREADSRRPLAWDGTLETWHTPSHCCWHRACCCRWRGTRRSCRKGSHLLKASPLWMPKSCLTAPRGIYHQLRP